MEQFNYGELKTLEEVEAKKAELRSKIESATTDEQITDLEARAAALDERAAEIRKANKTEERRSRLQSALAAGEKPETRNMRNPLGGEETESEKRSVEEWLESKEYRSAFAKSLMGKGLTVAEKRAVKAVMTTSTEFTEGVDSGTEGVSNGGLLIPADLDLQLMQRLELISPVFRDITRTSFPGVKKFPYIKGKRKAKRYGSTKETTENDDGQIEYAELVLKEAEISVTIPVTWKLETMAVDAFYTYFLEELTKQVARSLIEGAIYGTGEDDMEGVTVCAKKVEYEGTILAAIEANVGVLSAEDKVGAKLYLSTTAAEALQFSRDSDGRYIFPISNGLPKNVAGYAVESDPYLKDGDIVFGNLGANARLNIIEAMSVTTEKKGRQRRTEYTAYEIAASSARKEDCILYLTKKVSEAVSLKKGVKVDTPVGDKDKG